MPDGRGTVLTSHEAVDGLTRVVFHSPGERIWLAEAEDVTPLPGLAPALVRTDGLGLAPLPVAMRDVIIPGTYVRISARGRRQARVLSADAEATYTATDRFHVLPAVVEPAIGTDGRDALRLGARRAAGRYWTPGPERCSRCWAPLCWRSAAPGAWPAVARGRGGRPTRGVRWRRCWSATRPVPPATGRT
ncbi:hypothetical protein [Streptomyces goshikiensis]|uniref:hypothetical protein n=1 Tax=Streptomyces goshikiensis TaxID=1942 RepID=UPI00365A746F